MLSESKKPSSLPDISYNFLEDAFIFCFSEKRNQMVH